MIASGILGLPDILGAAGQSAFVKWAQYTPSWRTPLVAAVSNPNEWHGYEDVTIRLQGAAFGVQVKTKSSPNKRECDWTCARTGRPGGPRLEHGFEAFRFARYEREEMSIVFVEADGTLLLCEPERCGVRWGCFRSKNSESCAEGEAAAAAGEVARRKHDRLCQYFCYFDRAAMLDLQTLTRADGAPYPSQPLERPVVPFSVPGCAR